jgi:hypothetical protein
MLHGEALERPGAYGSLSQARHEFEIELGETDDLATPTNLPSIEIDHEVTERLGGSWPAPFSRWRTHR